MQAQHFMDETSLGESLRVVIAYNDIAAGKHAMRVMAALGKESGEEIEFRPIPWSFDLLADFDWAEVAANDAVHADILIIATSSPNPLPTAVGRWAESAISRKQGTSAAVVALFGPEEKPDGSGSCRLEAIQEAAHKAGLDFFAPAPRHQLDEAIARNHQRAETITPVLEENSCPPCSPSLMTSLTAMNNPTIETWPSCNTADAKQSWVDGSRPRILYVDDDASIRRCGQMLLTRSGYEVDTAPDGLEALAALRASPYNLLITDHEMPRLTGLQLAAQARLAGMNLPIVLVSGSVKALEDTDSARLGLAARVAKPFRVENLLEIISQALSAPTESCAGAAVR